MRKRALKATRISVQKDESTSLDRQDQVIDKEIDVRGLSLVGEARDVNVSAMKSSPFVRPKLGPWLNLRMDEFDVLLFWRLDRAVRSMSDLHKLMDWAQEQKKEIVFCEGPASNYRFDFTPGADEAERDIAMMFATVISWAARLETQSIKDRVTSSHKYLREHGEWGGGVVPYGLMPVRKEGQARGWVLVHNPETLPILQEIITRVIAGERLLPICRDLNGRGVPSPRDYWDASRGRKREKSRQWNVNGVKLMLQSRVLLGEWVYNGTLNVSPEGEPIPRCESIVTQSEWDDLQGALEQLSMSPKQRYSEPNPLLGVARCARCGNPYYMKQERQKGRVYSNLSCRTRHGDQFTSCGQPTISLKFAEEITSQITMALIGDQEVMSRRYIPGDDKSEELARLRERVKGLEDEYDSGLLPDRERYLARKRRLLDKIAKIGPNPVREAGFVWIGTGQTYGQVWPKLEPPARLKLLTDLGVRVYLGRGDATAAEKAYSELTEDSSNFRLSMVLNAQETNRMIAAMRDGERVSRNIEVWYLQQHVTPIHELVATKE